MPIIIPQDIPAYSTLAGENIFVMNNERASSQDIRPIEIAILNLMPTKIDTETQLMGITHTISLADYCRKVVNGEGVYYLNSNGNYDEVKAEQDKLIAAAFMNYASQKGNQALAAEILKRLGLN